MTTTKHGDKPDGVICENGVCRLAPKQDMPSRVDKPELPTASPVLPKPLTQQAVAQQSSPPVSHKNRAANNNRVASTNPSMVPLIGSPEEYAAPPTPAGYVARRQPPITNQSPARNTIAATQQSSSSINWESEKENWKPKGRMAPSIPSTNRKFDSTITPLPTRQTPVPPPATDVPSNPGKMFFEGNKVIGQSSTMGPSNQFRGQKQTVSSVPSPTLLPKMSNPAPSSFPKTNSAPFQESPQMGSMRQLPPKKFSNAGFDRLESPKSGRFNTQRTVETGSRESVMDAPIASTNAGGSIAKPNRSTRAPVQIIGSNRFRLNYGIDSIDPSGVGKVVLWMTRDDGRTWKTWGTDPDRRSPFPVEVTEQGRYGFRIVVQSKDGLTGQGPSSGDDADIWIVVDTTAPLTQITSVPYGRSAEAGKLIINYRVADPLLTLRPITLSYAANPAGPWEIIEEGVRNESRYAWKVSREVPEQIFLKIEAVDRAGNIGKHILSQPVDVSGLVPRGTIHGVTPVGSH